MEKARQWWKSGRENENLTELEYVKRIPVQYSITVLYDCTVTGDDSVSFVVLYINYPAYVVFAAQLCIFSVGIYLELQKPQGQ